MNMEGIFMKAYLQKNMSGVVLALGELIVGALLLFRPVAFTRGILIALGVVLAAAGLVSVVRYFRTNPLQAARERGLARGLGLLAVGAFCALNSEWFIAAFPVLTMLYGVLLLFGGLYKVQKAVDLLRLHTGVALWAGISAASTLLFAVIILCNPFATLSALWIFIGAILIGEAALDVAAMLLGQA